VLEGWAEDRSVQHASGTRLLAVGLSIDHSFSNKPAAGYANYYEKVSRYVEIISSEAKAIDPSVDACTFNLSNRRTLVMCSLTLIPPPAVLA